MSSTYFGTGFFFADNQPTTDRNNNWQIRIPKYTPPPRERLRTLNSWQVIIPLAVGGGFLLLPLIFPIICFRIAGNDSEEVFDVGIFGVLALVLWLSAMMLFYTTVLATVV